ncbi:hypothetical protein GHT06_015345 [Daphnia sinensis]|uniref:Small integral membrane protein 8 n=1 Tax=Daphnia sinensis TaxID=1820382 RepID=A0AAD5PT73_9CRUS|nr:hypothetical protein GHT06_015345 [Daphnia sinensis]
MDKKNTTSTTAPRVAGDGLRSVKTTGVFRALNFELYVKPNKIIMILGLVAIAGCAGYITYMKTKYENMGYYVAVREDGSKQLHTKKSRWD